MSKVTKRKCRASLYRRHGYKGVSGYLKKALPGFLVLTSGVCPSEKDEEQQTTRRQVGTRQYVYKESPILVL